MTTHSEVGISPVLLQAITQQLGDPNVRADSSTQLKAFRDENGEQKILVYRNDQTVILKEEPRSVMKRKSSDEIHVMEAADSDVHEPFKMVKMEEDSQDGVGELVVAEEMPQMIINDAGDAQSVEEDCLVNMNSNAGSGLVDSNQYVVQEHVISAGGDGQFRLVPQEVEVAKVPDSEPRIYYMPQSTGHVLEQTAEPVVTSSGEVSMGSVLSALASHHARLKQGTGSMTEMALSKSDEGDSNTSNQQIIIYTQEVPLPLTSSDVSVSSSEVIVADSQHSGQQPPMKRACIDGQQVVLINDFAETMSCVQGDRSGHSPWSNYIQQFSVKGPCPICGDKVSGYHYGIYCCESCKGFFKRTIQNKKSFSCHRKDDCDVMLSSRKKCPACRFKKCVMMGMKVGAVRGDRARGGRSVYDGCSPHLKRKQLFQDKALASGSKETDESQSPKAATSSETFSAATALQPCDPPSTNPLVAILNSPKLETDMEVIRPMVPQMVKEIMNLESILCEDEEEVIVSEEENFYTSLLQIADQRLYKIVRWARSLPDFAIISTDDQILLLQSAWADLLCLDCCWRSLRTPNEIKLSVNKSINLEIAEEIGAVEIVDRMIQLTEHLHRIQLDMSEFACLKVLLLMTPDVKGLKDINHIRDYQEKVTDAMMVYSSTHYPHHTNKFGELLLRIPEITKTSCIGKEMLGKKDLPAEISSFSLLMELLKTNPPT